MDPATILANGVVTALTALVLAGISKVESRKNPVVKEGDPAALVIVSLLAERLEPATTEDDYAYDGFWPVLVTIASRTSNKTIDPQTVRGLRWRIRRTLMELTLPGSGVTIDGPPGYEPHPPFDTGGGDVNVDYSPQLFVYRTQEPRGAV